MKRYTSNSGNCSLERIVMKNPFKNQLEFHNAWTYAELSASEPPRTDQSRTWATNVALLVSSYS